ncbi:hypothetical protein Q0Z83_016640 [Actinoplanes sichuanensis]|uniref:Cytochrome P450 n=1 Tax=Actinoplanes sichuanensis TaxID=512349 RepID=A0ABW4A6U7_9ACTN|nr:hypothetical protein [Actinoplanes sichuanensis]BEL03473.1 hypothetical protein Q0Z83_016640 [Actinoplanes sichuanensis]
MAEFPQSLELAISSLVNTLVYRIMTREGDSDALEEFVAVTGVPYVTDVTVRNYADQKAKEIWGPYMELPPPSSFDPAIEALADAQPVPRSVGWDGVPSGQHHCPALAGVAGISGAGAAGAERRGEARQPR